MKIKVEPFFRWYDLWIGVYLDPDRAVLYICPLPTLGIKVDLGVLAAIEAAVDTFNARVWKSETWLEGRVFHKEEYFNWDGDFWLKAEWVTKQPTLLD